MANSNLNEKNDVFTFDEQVKVPANWAHMVVEAGEVDEVTLFDMIANIHEAGLRVCWKGVHIGVSKHDVNSNSLGSMASGFLEMGVIPSLLSDGCSAVEFYDEKGALISEHKKDSRSAA